MEHRKLPQIGTVLPEGSVARLVKRLEESLVLGKLRGFKGQTTVGSERGTPHDKPSFICDLPDMSGERCAQLFTFLERPYIALWRYVWPQIEALIIDCQGIFLLWLVKPGQANIAPGSYVVVPHSDRDDVTTVLMGRHRFPHCPA